MAWRNSARCIGRIQWSKLQVNCKLLSIRAFRGKSSSPTGRKRLTTTPFKCVVCLLMLSITPTSSDQLSHHSRANNAPTSTHTVTHRYQHVKHTPTHTHTHHADILQCSSHRRQAPRPADEYVYYRHNIVSVQSRRRPRKVSCSTFACEQARAHERVSFAFAAFSVAHDWWA